ncbi:MAG: PTS sugar transporter subunit IIA [Candidatus Kapaibacterium sp.]|nr:PTS sugar transporter subunit IIA [Bacteroidota bacterium]
MNIAEMLTPSRICLQVRAETKEEVLNELIGILEKNGDLEDVQEVTRVIFEREKLMSTGIGHGIALPHGKTNAVKHTSAAMITLAQPVDYDSLDNQPVQLAIMLVGKENQVSTHLKLLSKISRIIANESFRHYAIDAENAEQIHKLFEEADEN